ncbi:F-box protein [Striga asiatica]|uniref:F-box protein n=1 Tax=Striga asiatica TaxID=4170 RepID=A0A5A7PEF5_STRAF|nr:F-box protein [Striga asiatica]
MWSTEPSVTYSVISANNNSIKLVKDDNLRANLSLLTDGNYNPIIGTADYYIVASCNRWMLVTCHENPSRPYGLLWNPAIYERESFAFSSGPVYKELPDQRFRDVLLWAFGVGFDSASGDYKVVRSCVYDDLTECVFAEVMSIRTGLWRTITYPHDPSIFLFSGSSIYINGFYYWMAYGPGVDGVVVSFDFAKEEFGRALIPLPKRWSVAIADCHGSLAAVSYDFERVSGEIEKPFGFKIWIWYAIGLSWSCLSTVDIPAVDVAVSAPLVHALGLYKNEILLAKNSESELLLYNLPSRMFLDLGIHHDKGPGSMTIIPFVGKI